MAICILSRSDVLASFLFTECEGEVCRARTCDEVGPTACVIVDAETVLPPYPQGTVLVIAREGEGQSLPCGARLLLRPLAVGEVRRALLCAGTRLVPETRTLMTDGRAIAFPAPEWDLFSLLYETLGNIVPKEALSASLPQDVDVEGLLTVYMYRVRRRLSGTGLSLRAVRGRGYLLAKEGTSHADTADR